MKKVIILILVSFLIGGCAMERRLVEPKEHIDIVELSHQSKEKLNLTTLKQIYGNPDVIDYENNVVAYVSKYELEEENPCLWILNFDPFGDSETEVWYLVLHTDSSTDESLKYEIFYEYFDPPSKDDPPYFMTKWPPRIHQNYQAIKSYCKPPK